MKTPGFGKLACLISVFCLAATLASTAQTYTKLFTFEGTNGNLPSGPLVQGTNGNLYGVTGYGGVSSNCTDSIGCGTVFEVTPEGKLTTLYNFCQQAHCTDGETPLPGLVLATNGNFYGMTSAGGTSHGGGTIFELSPAGKFTSLYSFCAESDSCPDGHGPDGTLMQAANGNLYGVTVDGGDYTHCRDGCGLIFEITMAGTYSTFHLFCSTATCVQDGRNPETGLIQATNGDFIGTTYGGGRSEEGIVYEITPTGNLTQIYNICSQSGCVDGWLAGASPIQAADGNLYGTTERGGTAQSGVMYELTLTKNFTDLYNFCTNGTGGACTDGSPPLGLVQGTDGNFYGVTVYGGTSTNCGEPACGGVLFEYTSAGQYNVIYELCSQTNCTDGGNPSSALMQATNGLFYGTDAGYGGGTGCTGLGCGTIFSLSMGLGPFVEANPNFSVVGKVVNILGNNLTGTTSVTFNGTTAKFQVISDTYLKAQVPTGATTGKIQVTTPSGTLSSNVAFQVLQ